MLKFTLLSAWDVGNYRFFCVSFWMLRETPCSRALRHVGPTAQNSVSLLQPFLLTIPGLPALLEHPGPFGSLQGAF